MKKKYKSMTAKDVASVNKQAEEFVQVQAMNRVVSTTTENDVWFGLAGSVSFVAKQLGLPVVEVLIRVKDQAEKALENSLEVDKIIARRKL